MKHFLEISQLSYEDAQHLLTRAVYFKAKGILPDLKGFALANLFYEPSTRTRISFEMAAKNLGIRVVDIDLSQSSEIKGEMIEDTIHTLFAMGIQLFVIRHPQNGLPRALAGSVLPGIHVINAGDGMHEHPSQALLDMMTILQRKPHLEDLKITVVGDIMHSRVANSLQNLCALLGVGHFVMVAPKIWHPNICLYGTVTDKLREGLEDADVVIGLRVQKERIQEKEQIDIQAYREEYAITKNSLAFAKPDVMIMHPGPLNRGVEMDSDVADSPRSYILEQVKNGVFMRMAILETLLRNVG